MNDQEKQEFTKRVTEAMLRRSSGFSDRAAELEVNPSDIGDEDIKEAIGIVFTVLLAYLTTIPVVVRRLSTQINVVCIPTSMITYCAAFAKEGLARFVNWRPPCLVARPMPIPRKIHGTRREMPWRSQTVSYPNTYPGILGDTFTSEDYQHLRDVSTPREDALILQFYPRAAYEHDEYQGYLGPGFKKYKVGVNKSIILRVYAGLAVNGLPISWNSDETDFARIDMTRLEDEYVMQQFTYYNGHSHLTSAVIPIISAFDDKALCYNISKFDTWPQAIQNAWTRAYQGLFPDFETAMGFGLNLTEFLR